MAILKRSVLRRGLFSSNKVAVSLNIRYRNVYLSENLHEIIGRNAAIHVANSFLSENASFSPVIIALARLFHLHPSAYIATPLRISHIQRAVSLPSYNLVRRFLFPLSLSLSPFFCAGSPWPERTPIASRWIDRRSQPLTFPRQSYLHNLLPASTLASTLHEAAYTQIAPNTYM